MININKLRRFDLKVLTGFLLLGCLSGFNVFSQEGVSLEADGNSFPDDLFLPDSLLIPVNLARQKFGSMARSMDLFFDRATPASRLRLGTGLMWQSQTTASVLKKHYGAANAPSPLFIHGEMSVWKNFSAFGELSLPNKISSQSVYEVSIYTFKTDHQLKQSSYKLGLSANVFQKRFFAVGAGLGLATTHIQVTSKLVEAPSFPNSNMEFAEIGKPDQFSKGVFTTVYMDIFTLRSLSLHAQVYGSYASDLKISEQSIIQRYTSYGSYFTWKTYKAYKLPVSAVRFALTLQIHLF